MPKQGHFKRPRRWIGWRTDVPAGPLTVILTRPVDRKKLAARELAVTDAAPAASPGPASARC